MKNDLNSKFYISEILLDQIDLVFWTVDKKLTFTSSLGGGLKYLGLTNNQVVGITLYEYFQTNNKDFEPIAYHLQALQGNKVDYFFEFNNRTFHSFLQPIYGPNNEIVEIAGVALDVTNERNLFKELKSSEEKYKSLFSSALDAIFLMDNENFIDCNPTTLKMFRCSREDIIGQPPYKLSPPFQPDGRLSKEKALELINRAYDGEDLLFEWVHTRLDGTLVYTDVKLNKVKIEDKSFLLAIVRDISEKKEKEQQIKLLANALESVNECVSITDLEDRIIYVNNKFEEVYGYKIDELLGKSISILRSDKNDPEIISQIFLETLKGGWKGELWNKRKNGEEFLIRLSTSPIYQDNNKIIATIGIATDITKEKELYNKIRYDAERLKILFENAPDPIFVIDFTGKIIEANRASEELVGWKREEAYGKNFLELKIFDKVNYFKALKVLSKSLNGKIKGPSEFEILNRFGDKIYVEVTIHPIEIEGIKYILCVARNITERKKILLELARAKDEADRANKQKSIFFASMSHEIRTPINAILGFSEVLRDLYYDKSDPEVKHYFEILQNAANNLLHTISQLLDFSRIESGSFKIILKEINFNNEIKSAVEILKMLAEKKNLRIQLNLPYEDIIVKADQYTLNGIITNLVSNSIKYSDQGTIYITLSQSEGYAICEIKDEGIGMSEDFQKNLFRDFTREESEKNKRIEGSGLGLALTKKYINLNNGDISISSKKGFGTTVTFKIPLAS